MPKRKIIIIPALLSVTSAYKAAAQTFTTAVLTKVQLDTLIVQNEDVNFRAGTNDFIINQTGLYNVSFSFKWVFSGVGSRSYQIFINGVTAHVQSQVPSGTAAVLSGSFGGVTIPLNVGDVIDLRAYQNTGGNLNSISIANQSPIMSIFKVNDL